MKNFLSKHSYDFVRILLVQSMIGGFFGFALAIAVTGIVTQNSETGSAGATSETLLLITSVCAIIFYLFLIYVQIWEIGGKDRILEDGGRRQKTPLRGLIVSLIAYIPMILMAILLLVTYPYGETMESAGNLYMVINMLTRFLHAMYLGLAPLYSPENPIVWLLVCLPMPVVAQFGYMLGNRNFRILGLFGIKPNLKDETR